MKQLTKQAFEKASQFISDYGRPLDLARYQYEFGEAPVTDVIESISRFQNDDGGFGNALEPDLRAPESSALCTSVALQTLHAIDIPHDHPMLLDALKYLRTELNEAQLSWRIIPKAAEKSPRAPWWNQAGRQEEYASFSLNPTAELLGYLRSHPSYSEDPILEPLTDRVISAVDALETIEMHDLSCCLRLLKTNNLPETAQDLLHTKLSKLIESTVCCDPDQWGEYNLRPLQVVDTPNSPFASSLSESIAHNLDYEIQSQHDNGAWTPTWSWGEQYPEEWKTAKREWSAILTLDKLLTLKRFNRIENDTD